MKRTSIAVLLLLAASMFKTILFVSVVLALFNFAQAQSSDQTSSAIPADARAQASPEALESLCANLPAAIKADTTLAQFGAAITACGKLPANNAVKLNPDQQETVDSACRKTASNDAPVAYDVKPCPLFEHSEDARAYCATHPANVFALGSADIANVAGTWCPARFSNDSPPEQARVFGMLLMLLNRVQQKKQADELAATQAKAPIQDGRENTTASQVLASNSGRAAVRQEIRWAGLHGGMDWDQVTTALRKNGFEQTKPCTRKEETVVKQSCDWAVFTGSIANLQLDYRSPSVTVGFTDGKLSSVDYHWLFPPPDLLSKATIAFGELTKVLDNSSGVSYQRWNSPDHAVATAFADVVFTHDPETAGVSVFWSCYGEVGDPTSKAWLAKNCK